MAKENLTMHHGQVLYAPKIYANTEGELVKATFMLKVMRRPMTSERIMSNKLYCDNPLFVTKNENLIKKIATLQIGDMVDVRGVITTKEVIKTTRCPSCGEKNQKAGNSVYITPIYLCRREEALTPEQGLVLLKERAEISNMVMVIGTLCREPDYYESETKHEYAQYQLAVNRKFRILEDPADLKTDYPWVKTFGPQALSDSQGLHMGSVVYINGAIQTREIEKTTICEPRLVDGEEIGCGTDYKWKDIATEIVPYSIEYLANCDIPESSHDEATDDNNNGGEVDGES